MHIMLNCHACLLKSLVDCLDVSGLVVTVSAIHHSNEYFKISFEMFMKNRVPHGIFVFFMIALFCLCFPLPLLSLFVLLLVFA